METYEKIMNITMSFFIRILIYVMIKFQLEIVFYVSKIKYTILKHIHAILKRILSLH